MAQTPEHSLTIDALKTHLREAVALLAEQANPRPYRNHLFALFLIKRLNDLFEERCRALAQEALAAGHTPDEAHARALDPDEHRWFVPVGARWSALRQTVENLGAQLEHGCAELERCNQNFLGAVLTPLQFEATGAVAEREQHEALLRKLVHHFEKYALGEQTLPVGRAGEFLIAHLAAWGAKKGGSFSSSAALMQLLAELLRPEPGMRVCDPACGAGGALLACAEALRQRGHSPQTLSLYGQEYDASTWALCKMNLLLHDLPDARIVWGSTLSQPLLDEAGRLLQFDLVIAEPPFALAEWEHEAAARVALGRFDAGLPPARRGELAFVQHIAATLHASGRAAVVVPHGVLFRGANEKQIRASLLQKDTDLVEAVLALPEGALIGHKAPSAILILNRNKPPARRARVLFIDAAHAAASARGFAWDDLTRLKLVALYQTFEQPEKLAQCVATLAQELRLAETQAPQTTDAARNARVRVESHAELERSLQEWAASRHAGRAMATATLEEIALEHDYNLSVGQYVRGADELEAWEIAPTLAELEELDQKKTAAEEEMRRILEQLGYYSH